MNDKKNENKTPTCQELVIQRLADGKLPDVVLDDMNKNSEYYKKNKIIYKYGYFDGYKRLEEAYKFAKEQRFSSLKKSFEIIDEFAIPTLSPDQYNKYEEVKKCLLEEYRV